MITSDAIQKDFELLYEGSDCLIYYRKPGEYDKAFVVKILKHEHPAPRQIARLDNEYELTRHISVKGIRSAFQKERVDNKHALFLEYVEGDTLRNVFRTPRPLDVFLQTAIAIAQALENLHRLNIIHKDLNSSNILVDLDRQALNIIDFGIASRLDTGILHISGPEALEGTPAYMSPEQTGRMERAVDHRSDLYSLGVIFYEMLTGSLPFEAADIMEWIHSHIAKKPKPVHEIKPDIPCAVSNIVMKLLEKNVDARYRNAWGLKADLQTCLQQLWQSGEIKEFTCGQQEAFERFQISQKLYGRKNEIKALLAAFDQAAKTFRFAGKTKKGKAGIVLVTGKSGIGKSSLVQAIREAVNRQGGYFITGKFEQLQRNVPYSAVTGACTDLARLLLTETETQLHRWRKKLNTALHPDGQVIIDAIPEMELIIGKQAPLPGPVDAENHFNLVSRKFIRVFCRAEHPLVMFLDDLQWADSATLKWIEQMITGRKNASIPPPFLGTRASHPRSHPHLAAKMAAPTEKQAEGKVRKNRHFLLIGAYRDDETGPGHPLTTMIEKLQAKGTLIKRLPLSPLSCDHVARFVGETLHADSRNVRPLAELVTRKTAGNPFFVKQFLKTLHEQQQLVFDAEHLRWRWDIARIEQVNITDNVATLMIDKLKKQPKSTRQILRLAACIGCSFDLDTLALIHKKTARQTARDLFPAIAEGLILDTQSTADLPSLYHFLHDRVWQAAYALIGEKRKHAIHLRIGRILQANTHAHEWPEKIFGVADHLNIGRKLVSDPGERAELAKLNLLAGRKARNSGAYTAAAKYLSTGMDCLHAEAGIGRSDELKEADTWTQHYELVFDLYKARAEAEYLTGHFENSGQLLHRALDLAKSAAEKAGLYELLLVQYTLEAKYAEAIRTGRKALSLLGVELPEQDFASAAGVEIAVARKNLADGEINSLIDRPAITAAGISLAIKILTRLTPPAYLSNIDLWAVCVTKIVNLSLQYGHIPESSVGYANFGIVLGAMTGDYCAGHQLALLALALSEKFNHRAQKCKDYTACSFTMPWVRHIRYVQSFNKHGYKAGLESGELQYAGYNLALRTLYAFYQGQNLQRFLAEATEAMRFAEKTGNRSMTDLMSGCRLIALNLIGMSGDPADFCSDEMDEFVKNCGAHASLAPLCTYYIHAAQVLYLYGKPSEALKCTEKAEALLGCIPGLFSQAEHNFYHSLILAALYPHVSAEEQKRCRLVLKTNQEQMKAWAHNCVENFKHKYLLAEAEIARLEGRNFEAMQLYKQSVQSAKENEFVQNGALANELAGKFYLQNGFEEFAALHLRKARYYYGVWGAERKVQALEEEYPSLFTHTSAEETPCTTDGFSPLDLDAVIKASQAISGETDPEKLLGKLMEIVIETAGAQKGFLLAKTKGQLHVEASATTEEVEVRKFAPFTAKPALPETIVRYVERTGENILLHDAAREGRFMQDAYVVECRPRSILCVPMHRHDKTAGVLYLENNLAGAAFSEERIELLEILLSQAAISLENARLFEKRRQAKEAAIKSNALLQAVIKQAPFGISLCEGSSDDWRLMLVNQEGQRILGVDEEQYKGVGICKGKITCPEKFTWKMFYPDGTPWPFQKVPLYLAMAEGRLSKDREMIVRRADGVEYMVLCNSSPIYDGNGKLIAGVVIYSDITERKRTEEMMIQSEKMLTVGGLAAGMAHEINNPLAGILQNVQVIRNRIGNDLPKNERTAEECGISMDAMKAYMERRGIFLMIDSIMNAGRHAAQLVQNMLSFSRKGEAHFIPHCLNELLDKTVELASNEYDLKKKYDFRQIEIVREYDPELPEIPCEASKIQQVFLNILKNGAQSMAENRKDARLPRFTLRIKPEGDMARVEIEDNGPGMDEAARKHAFEPFFTTKEVGIGTGLGLSVSYFIITENHDGTLTIESSPGQGAKFVIRLPVSPRPNELQIKHINNVIR
ncbi:MAG: AAA family ATPase [Gammaproteobacteria bacterium]|nr:AAA family ATPase [Gammaproteobacteria bacterium]